MKTATNHAIAAAPEAAEMAVMDAHAAEQHLYRSTLDEAVAKFEAR